MEITTHGCAAVSTSPEQLDGNVSVIFDKKEGAVGETGHTNARDPFGKSGGAIFGLPVDGHHIRPQQTTKLVGIPTRWKRAQKSIRGSSISVLIPLLDQLVGGATQS